MIKFCNIWDNRKDVFVKTKNSLLEYLNYDWYFTISLQEAKEKREHLSELKRKDIVQKMEH